MYKRMIILTYALVFFSLFATACSDNNNETYVEPILSQIEVSKLVTENNKTYVSVDGKPFPFLGAQIRLDALLNCDKMTINEVEKNREERSGTGTKLCTNSNFMEYGRA